jgi:hypothetical protein
MAPVHTFLRARRTIGDLERQIVDKDAAVGAIAQADGIRHFGDDAQAQRLEQRQDVG